MSRPHIDYRRPPLTEVVQEFHFAAETISWKEAYWDQIAEVFRGALPVSEQAQITPLNTTYEGATPAPPYDVRRYTTDAKSIVLTVGNSMFGLSLRPRPVESEGYIGWEAANRIALAVLNLYERLVRSSAVIKVVIRYINRIPVIPGDFVLERYVSKDCGIIPRALYSEKNPFVLEVSELLSASDTELRNQTIRLSAGGTSNNSHELLLRIDEVAQSAPTTTLSLIPRICAELHDAATGAFISIFNFETLASFEPIESPELVTQ